MDNERIIAEQRDQLLQLRAENKRLRAGGTAALQPTQLGIQLVMSACMVKTDGTTIGMKIDLPTRNRLFKQQDRFKAKSYRQVVQACIELGLRQLEETCDDKPSSVEEVPAVQRNGSQGDQNVPLAATS